MGKMLGKKGMKIHLNKRDRMLGLHLLLRRCQLLVSEQFPVVVLVWVESCLRSSRGCRRLPG